MSKRAKKSNGKARQPKKAVGHDNRVSAIARGKRRESTPPEIRTQPDRIRGLKPAFDGTPNMPPEDAPHTPASIGESPIQVDEQLAASQLYELAELHAEVQKAQDVYERKAEDAKTAKKTVESKTFLLLEKLRMFTHPPSMPLFDQAMHNRDVTRMLDADQQARTEVSTTTDENDEMPLTGEHVVESEVDPALLDTPETAAAPAAESDQSA